MKFSIEAVARICHQTNKAHCEAAGDHSQVDWEFSPDWQRESMIAGVRLHLDNPSAGPRASHEAWMRHKQAEGWVYGPTKDAELKQHPCMVQFDELPDHQQAKDRLICAIVESLRPMTANTWSPAPAKDQLLRRCNCGHEFPEYLGANGCPNCEGDEGLAPVKGDAC